MVERFRNDNEPGSTTGAEGLKALAPAAALLGAAVLLGLGTRRRSAAGTALGTVAGALAIRWATGNRRKRGAAVLQLAPRAEAKLVLVPGGRPLSSGITIEKTVLVNRSAVELYHFWHHFERLPLVMRHLKSVRSLGGMSEWELAGPFGMPLSWKAEITEDVPNRSLAWRSLPGGLVDASGAVTFTPSPSGRGTEVKVLLSYAAPGGTLLSKFAKAFGEAPEQQLKEDLRRFKQLLETGEIATTDGQPRGAH